MPNKRSSGGEGSRKSGGLLDFFSPKKPKADDESTDPGAGQTSADAELPAATADQEATSATAVPLDQPLTIDVEPDLQINPNAEPPLTPRNPIGECDVGVVAAKINKNIPITDLERYQLLTTPWKPEKNYTMPYKERMNRGRTEKRFLSAEKHLKHGIEYSHAMDGLFCVPCVLFAPREGGKGGNNQLQKLVTQPCSNYDRLLGADGYFDAHFKTQYHKDCCVAAEEFQKVYRAKGTDNERDIMALLDPVGSGRRTKEAQENRLVMKSLIEQVIFCGEMGLALRGHRDSGRMAPPADATVAGRPAQSPVSEGIFRRLVYERAQWGGDLTLKNHLSSSAANAMYLSPRIQNEIIDSCGKVILAQIVTDVREAQFFAVLADETADISRHEQFSIFLRYIKDENIMESFVGFSRITDLTGRSIANQILEQLELLHLDMTYCVGQGYDGAANMSGQFNGAQALIRQQFPQCLYVHCGAHALNLTVLTACTLPAVQSTLKTMQAYIVFFSGSPRRMNIFENSVKTLNPASGGKSHLVQFCKTRWVESAVSVNVFVELIEATATALETMSATEENAGAYFSAIQDFEFLVTLCVLDRILTCTKALSEFLQRVDVDYVEAAVQAEAVVQRLRHIRGNNATFGKAFKKAEEIRAHNFGEPAMLTGTKMRVHNLVTTEDVQHHLLNTVFNPFVDTLKDEIARRFTERDSAPALALGCLIPNYIGDKNFEQLKPAVDHYKAHLVGTDDQIEEEYEQWKALWVGKATAERPGTALTALNQCNGNFYPYVRIMLQILATLPVSTASVERSFSTLRRTKNYLRNKTGEERLSGLALMNVHKEKIRADPDTVLEHFIEKQKRRMTM